MIRIIDGLGRPSNAPGFDISTATAFLGQGGDSYRVKAYDLGNGQLEASASRSIVWTECDWAPGTIRDHLEMMANYREENSDELALRHAERAAKRARTRVRHICKAMGTDSLVTLTYRALVTDLDLCKRHLKEFNRRLKRWLPSLRMVAGFEKQKRGAWHVHLATVGIPHFFMEKNTLGVPCRVKSYDLLRRVWLSVVGDLGGAANLARAKSKRSTCAKVAAYISKYITKEYESGEKWSNRWTKFGECEFPPPVDLGLVPDLLSALELIGSLVLDGQKVGQLYLPRWHDFVFLSVEPPSS